MELHRAATSGNRAAELKGDLGDLSSDAGLGFALLNLGAPYGNYSDTTTVCRLVLID